MEKLLVLSLGLLFVATVSEAKSGSSRTILALQKSIESQDLRLSDGSTATLLNLNPSIGSWYLLNVKSGALAGWYHLEITDPVQTKIRAVPDGVIIQSGSHQQILCPIFNPQDPNYLGALSLQQTPFSRLCQTEVSLRKGANKNVVDEDIAQRLLAKPVRSADPRQAPRAAQVDRDAQKVRPLGDIAVRSAEDAPGTWAPSKYHSGIYVSAIQPNQVSTEILNDGLADPLGPSEGQSRVALVAISLNEFTVGWGHGPLLPGLGHWSKMFPVANEPDGDGPDAIRLFHPINATTGVVNPIYLPSLEAVMCGGFQRYHGKMRENGGPYAGRYFGFIQEGVVLASMSRGLATLVMYKNGDVTIKAWEEADNERIDQIRFARQNGVPIVLSENDRTVPSPFVRVAKRFFGNWSGSATGSLETPRSGVCLAESGGSRFLIYGYFASATPSAMARVFQAYNCQVAMHLDMNNPEWAYFGLLSKTTSGDFVVEHASSDMKPKDGTLFIGGKKVPMPRFVAHPDKPNPGDFFYFLRKN